MGVYIGVTFLFSVPVLMSPNSNVRELHEIVEVIVLQKKSLKNLPGKRKKDFFWYFKAIHTSNYSDIL
jgi:hypothetical protein